MEKNQYPCTQQELYLSATEAWNLFILHIGDFTSFSKSYSVKYFEERMLDLKEAQEITERSTLHCELKELRKQLVKQKNDVLHYYKCASEYIKKAYYHDMANVILDMAGKKEYPKAANNDWIACMDIIIKMSAVLKKNKDDLLKNDNMSHEFFDQCMETFDQFTYMHIKYLSFKRNVKVKSHQKVDKNNKIYADLTTTLRHAKLIYRHRPGMQTLFRFECLLKNVRVAKKVKTSAEKPKRVSLLSRVVALF